MLANPMSQLVDTKQATKMTRSSYPHLLHRVKTSFASSKTKTMAALVALMLFLALNLVLLVLGVSSRYVWGSQKDPRLIIAKQGAVSSENPICSYIGTGVLQEGGSAVDAAIATTLCIGVTNSYSSGIGGGGFMLVRNADGSSEVVDFRETAPAASNKTMFQNNPTSSRIGGLAVGVPGEIRGFQLAHQRHGRLPWVRLFQPSIQLCLEGWKVNQVLAARINTSMAWILKNPNFMEVFAPNGVALVQGQTIRRTQLGLTLQQIARNGADVFYKGEIASQLVAETQKAGGIMTMEDMASYEAVLVPTLVGFYHGHRVLTVPPPASGPVVLSVLNIMEGYDLKSEGRTFTNIHRLTEAFKFGFAQRSYYGDPSDISNITKYVDEFVTKEHAAEVRLNITDSTTHNVSYYQPAYDIEETAGTAHISVYANGEAVSITSTVNQVFGAQLMNQATGIVLNNEMDDFSMPDSPNGGTQFGLPPSPFNFVAPNKRPLSSCVPTIVEKNGRVEIVVGASGGSFIVTATLQTIINILDYGQDPLESVLQPRFHHQLVPNIFLSEFGFPEDVILNMQHRNHNTSSYPLFTGVETIRVLDDGLILASSDPRKGGLSAGY
ncbi:hypothetical protein SmJEL517_g01481 [Synchytrium microbalum]|uniref:Glutathione hydrolase n=1 Tax=Synchytrium microbalum TaxID=1806994 RepID=A0A507CEH0_9FUNG|nr:uncharacterized protein SmJEL517_g01481 [Synchytrium microbalum]TPX36314.1 hypothetical protein SmJEL517_g01481 [Synchytrium microbalum]